MDYHPVSCNRGAPLVSRGGFAAYDLNPGRWVGPGRLWRRTGRQLVFSVDVSSNLDVLILVRLVRFYALEHHGKDHQSETPYDRGQSDLEP